MNRLVIHDTDHDGFGAAWAFHLKFGQDCKFIGIGHGRNMSPEIFEECKNSDEVYITDLSFSREVLCDIAENCNLHVWDHHASSKDQLNDLPFTYYDLTRSACTICYSKLFPNFPIPKILEYVEDRDIWKWELPFSEEINLYLSCVENNFDKWSKIDHDITYNFDEVVDKGRTLIKMKEALIRQAIESVNLVKFEEHVVPFVNTSLLSSEIGNVLSEKYPFAVIWFQEKDWFKYSLRSSYKNPDCVDVSKIAIKYGGGGHRHAAGFRMKGLHESLR